MLTYTFTTREKFLLAIAIVLLGGLAWYYFVFAAVQLRVDALDTLISSDQDQISLASSQLMELQIMREEIETYQAEGRVAVEMPPYDNTSAIMDKLNGTIGVGKFRLSADGELDVETEGMVKRGMSLEFRASSYESARAILDELAEGEYPCSVESVAITDESASRNSTDADHVVVSAHITFYEEDVYGIFALAASSDAEGN